MMSIVIEILPVCVGERAASREFKEAPPPKLTETAEVSS